MKQKRGHFIVVLPTIVRSDLTARFAPVRRFAYTHCERGLGHGLHEGLSHWRESQQIVKFGNWLSHFATHECGVTAIEYGLIAAGIGVAIIATIAALSANLNTTYSNVSGGL